jgi:hypothetical protein
MPKIVFFCLCHGHRQGSRADRRVHRPYSDGYKTTATYEARRRVGNRWINRQQLAARHSRGGGR